MNENENAKREMTIEELIAKQKEYEQKSVKLANQIRERKVAEEKRKQEELKSTKEARKKEVDNAIKVASDLLTKYMKDYGAYDCKTSSSTNDGFDIFWPHNLFF